MKRTNFAKILSVILCFVLVAAIALFANGCGAKKNNAANENPVTAGNTVGNTENGTAEDKNAVQNNSEEVTKLGKGEKTFSFTVKDSDGKETKFEIKSDKKTVGDALTEQGLISGTTSEYGLMVDTVMGIRADYNKDKAYWAFYVGGEYAQSGVDSTPLVEGELYMFEYTKA